MEHFTSDTGLSISYTSTILSDARTLYLCQIMSFATLRLICSARFVLADYKSISIKPAGIRHTTTRYMYEYCRNTHEPRADLSTKKDQPSKCGQLKTDGLQLLLAPFETAIVVGHSHEHASGWTTFCAAMRPRGKYEIKLSIVMLMNATMIFPLMMHAASWTFKPGYVPSMCHK